MALSVENFNVRFFKRIFKLFPWFFPSCCSKPSLLFLLLLALCLLEQYVIYNIGLVPSKYYKVLGYKDQPGFLQLTLKALGLISVEAFIKATITFMSSFLYLTWRDLVTKRLQRKYFKEVLYYAINVLDKTVDNPDQRITQDVDQLCDNLSQLIAPLLIAPFTIGYYMYKAQESTGYIGPVSVLIFFIVATVINKILMSPVVRMVFRKEKMEGNFRFKHMQIRSNSESAAFYRSGQVELKKTNIHLDNLINTQHKLITRQYALNFSVNMCNYLGSILSYIGLAFPIFLGAYDSLTPQDLSSLISQNAFIVIYLINCFTNLIDLSSKVTVVAGTTHRVVEMMEVLDHLQSDQETQAASRPSDMRGFGWSEMETLINSEMTVGSVGESPGEVNGTAVTAFTVSDLTYHAPSSTSTLCSGLSFKFEKGVNILVTGDSGCGKSSLLRVINGIWPEVRGLVETNVSLKPNVILFLPQKPYFTDGSLRQQIIYPVSVTDRTATLFEDDEVMMGYLDKADLSHICTRVKGLDTCVDWNWYDQLSPGEMQRLSFVRLFYHKPIFAVLDEATSQVGLDMEQKLYSLCAELGISVLSVGHRDSLRQYHHIELNFDGSSGWTVRPIVNNVAAGDVRGSQHSIQRVE